MCIIIILVLRRLTTWLRNTTLGQKCLPIDNFLEFHKFIGVFILVLSVIHSIAHSINLYFLSHEYKQHNISHLNASIGDRASYVELLFTFKSNIGWFYGSAIPTGWAILVFMLVLDVFAIPFFRKKGYFQLFYYSHWLHLPIYIITFFHAANFWKWIIVPAVFVLFECVLKSVLVKSTYFGTSYIKNVNLLPSKVTHLVIARPKNFRYNPGDYLFIKIPQIALYEWHPFTISSAPELENELWIHIRSLGNWTNKVHEHFWNYSKFNCFRSITKRKRRLNNLFGLFGGSSLDLPDVYANRCNMNTSSVTSTNYNLTADAQIIERKTSYDDDASVVKLDLVISNKIKDVWYKVKIDGPYGTASSRAFHAEHAVLVASGIGVTPFASILQSLWFRYSECARTCPNCNHQWYDKFQARKLKKIDFIWVNRDYKSFEWFIELLAKLELQQSMSKMERFINIRLFITSDQDDLRIKSINSLPDTDFATYDKLCLQERLLELVNNIQHGRPKLDEIFKEISAERKGDVKVFFCGANQFGKVVRKTCQKYSFKFSREYF